MKILGLDVGEKRIGIARADSSTRIAVPIGFIEVNGTEWQEIAKVANLNNTNYFVLGLPRSNEGNETKQSEYVREFARRLKQSIPEAKIVFQDESLTSVVAEERLRARRKVYGKGEIDAEAASIILQDFLERFTDKSSADESTINSSTPEDNNSETVSKNAKKEENVAKKKQKSGLKAVMGVMIALVVIAGAAGGVLFYLQKQKEREEREQYWAEQEAKMNEEATFDFTIRPGETIYEIKSALAEAGYEQAEIEEAFNADYDFAFLKERPEGATLEGYLFGETHEFYKTATVKEVLETYLTGMGQVIEENDLEAKFAARGLSLFEGITLASIVQSEAGSLASDMPNVASVFYNRLAYGIPLGSDVTVSYALDTIDPDRQSYTDNQAALTVESCYNTRANTGLPCGPISNPGLSALLAAAEPADTSYLYFLTGDDGMMYYSYTEAEHNQNAANHCQDLCNISL